VIKILEASGVTKVITLDLHSKQLEGVFNVPIINLDPASIFFPFYKDDINTVVVSPDIGGIARANNFSLFLDKDLVIINKTRDADNECSMSTIIGNVKDKKCIIIDDIVDSGSTLCKAVELLRSNGALNIEAYITHPVLSSDSKERIMDAQIDKIFVSDSIHHSSLPDKFIVTFIDQLISCVL
jgi:ribose-phosphate pyrophosphokinase